MSIHEPLIIPTYDDTAAVPVTNPLKVIDISQESSEPPPRASIATSGNMMKKNIKKRADAICVLDVAPHRTLKPAGNAWAACVASEIRLDKVQQVARRKILASSKLELRFEQFFSDVFIGYVLIEGYKSSSSQIGFERDVNASPLGHTNSPHDTISSGGTNVPTMKPRRCQIYTFKFGCICAWDLPAELRTDLITLMERFLESPVRDVETDTINYVWATSPGIQDDTVHLAVEGAQEQLSQLSPDDLTTYRALTTERLAYSYGLAQSCKLSVFEINIENAISRTRKIPECLARYGRVTQYKRHDISLMIGELFMHRFNMNLQCDIILDTPDTFWEENESVLQAYTTTRNYLDITERCKHLNLRLDIIKDLYDILNQEMTEQHNCKLEWIVIFLIAGEIFIEVVWNIMVKDVLKLF